IRDITCNNPSGVGKAGVHITSLANGTVAAVERVHVEGFEDGIFFDNEVSGSARDVDCTNDCTNGVHIGESCSDISLSAVTVTTARNIIRNDCLHKNIERVAGGVHRTLASYQQSNYAGNPAHVSYWNGQQWIFE